MSEEASRRFHAVDKILLGRSLLLKRKRGCDRLYSMELPIESRDENAFQAEEEIRQRHTSPKHAVAE